jgi:galactose mutarotase-like enzyme
LDGEKLLTRYEVTNTDNREMIVAFGGHPGINIPFGEGEFEDYYLDFGTPSSPQRQLLDESISFMAKLKIPSVIYSIASAMSIVI